MFFRILFPILFCHIFTSLNPSSAFGEPNAAQSGGATADKAAQASSPFQRAAMLVEALEEPNRAKTYLGEALWSTAPTASVGDPLENAAVQVNLAVPQDQLKVQLTLEKNDDTALHASHLIKVTFIASPESATGLPAQIGLPQMRAMDSGAGTALAGAVAQISAGHFLVALSDERRTYNIDLLRSRDWFDIPIRFSNGKRAKLTFEKGPDGRRLIDQTAELSEDR